MANDISNAAAPDRRQISEGHRPNTNLEDVSDWLTKIIIGVSLVQAGTILAALDNTSDQIGKAVGLVYGDPKLDGSFSAFATFCIVYFFVAGLYFGYLWTRLKLQTAIKESDATLSRQARAQVQSMLTSEIDSAVQKRLSQEDADLEAQRAFDEAAAVDFVADASSQAELTRVFIAASETKRNEIFRLFREALKRRGRENTSDSPDANGTERVADDEVLRPVSALLPIIGGLIGADKYFAGQNGEAIPRYHANYAQRAYVYLKMKPAEYDKAIANLAEAIRIRDEQYASTGEVMPHSLLFYELMRAKAHFKAGGGKSEEEGQRAEKVRKDLSKVMATPWGQMKMENHRNKDIAEWWSRFST